MKHKVLAKMIIIYMSIFLLISFFAQTIYAIGISPGRQMLIIPYNLDNGWDYQIEYWLYAPSERQYSTFSVSGELQSIYDIHAGISPNNESHKLIDWDSINANTTSVFMDLHLDPGWLISGGPGHQLFIRDAVRHIEADPEGGGIGGIASVASQLVFYQNYVPELQIAAQEDIGINEVWQLDVMVKDFHNAPHYLALPARRFSYQIDWNGDGQFDESSSGLPYYNELGEIVDYRNLSGWAHGEFSITNTFSTPGSHSIYLSVSDSIDTTTIEIPINVVGQPVPIPSTILLFSFGLLGILGFRKKYKMK